MTYTTLISTADLSAHLTDPDWAIVDCRFMLADPGWGRREYLQAHIPGAVYAHLDEDLSGPVRRGVTGRHPLPPVQGLVQKLSGWGIGPGVQVAAYDSAGGALAAARLWWLLRWLGHDQAAVLDGGWQAWQGEERPTRSGEERRPPRAFTPHPRPALVASSQEVEEAVQDAAFRLLDARSHDRYLGQNETIDPVAGHIPGALPAPYAGNLDSGGKFQAAEKLRESYKGLLGETPAGQAIFYCGSGVTAAHNVLAVLHAGLDLPRLYAGSWSEWITDPRRPVER
jgi:thiosulfate/3-mercaptopyruvate sulfurtransferase